MNEEMAAFDMCREEIELALEELKINMPELWLHLKESIKIDENNKTFSYQPTEPTA